MKSFSIKVSIVFFFISVFTFAQKDEVVRYNSVFIQGDLFHAHHYNSPFGEPTYQTNGGLLGAAFGVVESPSFHFDFRIGYRYIQNYAQSDAIIFFPNDLVEDYNYNYHGGWVGAGFNVGYTHQWETAILIGGGMMIRKNPTKRFGSMETSVQTGYRYIADNGLLLRLGGTAHFGRNGFFSPMYSGYVSVGYAFKKSKGEYVPKEKEKQYGSITINPYLVNLSGALVGLFVQGDYFLFNGETADIGFSVAARVGVPWDDDIQFSTNFGLVSLIGGNSSKFEISVGPNIPLGDNVFKYVELFELLHFGMGYRLMPENSNFTLRVGSATTSILYFGVGFRLGKGL